MLRLAFLFICIALTTAILLNDETASREIIAAAPRKHEGACSDEKLRKLMHQGMSDSATESKKGVSMAVTEAIGGSWAVVCAECTISLVFYIEMTENKEYFNTNVSVTKEMKVKKYKKPPFSMRLQYVSPAIVLLLVTVLIRHLWNLQYYITLSKEPLWEITYEKPRQFRGNSTLLVLLDSFSNEKADAVLDSWLKQADHAFIFSRQKKYNLDTRNYVLFRVKSRQEWIRLRMMSWFAFLTLPLHMDWLVFAHDDSFIIIDQLKKFLSSLDVDAYYVGVVGTRNFEKPREKINYIHFMSRAAFKKMALRIQFNEKGCDLTDSLWNCLHDATHLNLDMDELNKYRYFPMNRHFSPSEMKDFTRQHGFYDDGFQIIHQLSASLLSFHNLEVDDIRVLDVLLNRVRLWT